MLNYRHTPGSAEQFLSLAGCQVTRVCVMYRETKYPSDKEEAFIQWEYRSLSDIDTSYSSSSL